MVGYRERRDDIDETPEQDDDMCREIDAVHRRADIEV